MEGNLKFIPGRRGIELMGPPARLLVLSMLIEKVEFGSDLKLLILIKNTMAVW